ncbi:cation channel sperm-associated auxiliary subunit TMEM249-like [Glandiceps talaboti]
MVVGIFGTWNLQIAALTKPEAIFKKKLEDHHTYPFTEIKPGYFTFITRSSKLWKAVFVVVSILIGILGWYVVNPLDQNITILLIVVGSACYTILKYKDKRTIIINANDDEYEFYTANSLVYRGHIHNIYIRLRGLKGGGGDMYFTIVLNGYHVEEQELSSTGTNREKLEKLAKLLASRLGINYFDFKDKSTKHILSKLLKLVNMKATQFNY